MREIKFRAWDKEEQVMGVPFDLYNIGMVNGEDGYDSKYYELLQYTGLRDKNGKEIYEGDIVQDSFDEDNPQILEISYEVFGWINHSHHYCSEVIGNIYENPKLIK